MGIKRKRDVDKMMISSTKVLTVYNKDAHYCVDVSLYSSKLVIQGRKEGGFYPLINPCYCR
jgi:hypothetical protein